MVRERRLELLYLAVPDPKSGASANSATLAVFELIKLGQLPCFVKVISKTIPFESLIQLGACAAVCLLQVCLPTLQAALQ